VRADAPIGEDTRWLTVGPKEQRDLEIILIELKGNQMLDKESASQLRGLVEQGKLGAAVFETNDCRATYEELKSKGVEFISPPQEQSYGIEAIFKDNSGNWFSMTQRL